MSSESSRDTGTRFSFLSLGDNCVACTLVRRRTVVSGITILRTLPRNADYDWFRHEYGPSRNSQYAEEWLIRDFFGDQGNGFFVDVGAHDYERFSNTYYLETALGWSGQAIDAQDEFAVDEDTGSLGGI